MKKQQLDYQPDLGSNTSYKVFKYKYKYFLKYLNTNTNTYFSMYLNTNTITFGKYLNTNTNTLYKLNDKTVYVDMGVEMCVCDIV